MRQSIAIILNLLELYQRELKTLVQHDLQLSDQSELCGAFAQVLKYEWYKFENKNIIEQEHVLEQSRIEIP